jgi:hypothetical protein
MVSRIFFHNRSKPNLLHICFHLCKKSPSFPQPRPVDALNENSGMTFLGSRSHLFPGGVNVWFFSVCHTLLLFCLISHYLSDPTSRQTSNKRPDLLVLPTTFRVCYIILTWCWCRRWNRLVSFTPIHFILTS